ncbi:MAG: hypothetical protein HY094_01675 [Candidatus Melainabacteria bacterium]|nr:hypothetical protein [Candidatus Melainabacteria bacterium]
MSVNLPLSTLTAGLAIGQAPGEEARPANPAPPPNPVNLGNNAGQADFEKFRRDLRNTPVGGPTTNPDTFTRDPNNPNNPAGPTTPNRTTQSTTIQVLSTGSQAATVACAIANIGGRWVPGVGAVLSVAQVVSDGINWSRANQQLDEMPTTERMVDASLTALMQTGVMITEAQKTRALALARADLTTRDNQLALRTHLSSCGIEAGAIDQIIKATTDAAIARRAKESERNCAAFDCVAGATLVTAGAVLGSIFIPIPVVGTLVGAAAGGLVVGAIKLCRWLFG